MSPAPATFRLPPIVSRDLRDYVPALEEIASEARIDPVLLLTDSDDPKCERALRRLPMAEFIVGYLHCLCAAIGTSMRPLWAALQAEFGDPGDRPRRRRGPGDRELEGGGRKRLPAKSTPAKAAPRVLALPAGAPPPVDAPSPAGDAPGLKEVLEAQVASGAWDRAAAEQEQEPASGRARRRRKAHGNQGRLPLG